MNAALMSQVSDSMFGMSWTDASLRISAWNTEYEHRLSQAKKAAKSVDEATLVRAELNQLVDGIVDDHAARPVVLHWDQLSLKTHENLDTDDANVDGDAGLPTLAFTARLPVEGAALALKGGYHEGQGTGDQYSIGLRLEYPYDGDEADPRDELATLRSRWFARLEESAQTANEEIAQHREEMRAAVLGIVGRRQRQIQALTSAAIALDIPLNPTPSARQVSIPVKPRALTLRTVEEAADAGGSEAGLASNIADALVSQIWSFAAALERLSGSANKLAGQDEETLRDILLFILNANWSGQVTGETFVGEGKTDLHMTWRERVAFIGECKFWDGERKFSDALGQLLDRYTVWRATRVALILFIKNRQDITEIIKKATAAIAKHPRYLAETTREPEHLTSALMRAQHDHEQLVTLTLVPVVIPSPRATPNHYD